MVTFHMHKLPVSHLLSPPELTQPSLPVQASETLYQEGGLALSRLPGHQAQPPPVAPQLLHCVLKKARSGRARWVLQLLKGGLDQVIILDGHWLLQLDRRLRTHGAVTTYVSMFLRTPGLKLTVPPTKLPPTQDYPAQPTPSPLPWPPELLLTCR